MDINKLYNERVKKKAEKYIKEYIGPSDDIDEEDYEEIFTQYMEIFLAGANCAYQVLSELAKLDKE